MGSGFGAKDTGLEDCRGRGKRRSGGDGKLAHSGYESGAQGPLSTMRYATAPGEGSALGLGQEL